MDRDKIEKLGTLFMVVFSTGLALLLAAHGMAPRQYLGALLAVVGSVCLSLTVRAWPHPAQARVRDDRSDR